MSRRGPRGLVALVALALIVESVSVIGWWGWRRAVGLLEEDAAGGAHALIGDPLLRLPSVSRRSRRLPGGDLARAPDDLVARALRALGRDQIRWTPADSFGFANVARAELIEGALNDATASLDAAVFRNPTSPALHRLAALAARAQGRNLVAVDHLAAAAGLSPASVPEPIELTPEEQRQVRIEGLERRLEYYPRARSAGVVALARELRAREQEDEGKLLLENEVADPRIVLELARWDLDADRPDRAEARLLELAQRRGLTASILAETWGTVALARDAAGDLDGAVAAAERALTHDPGSATPYRVLATLAERRGDTDEALALLRRAWGMDPTDVGLLLTVARAAEKAGQLGDSRLALERATRVEPSNPRLRASLVEFELRQGEYMQATLTLADALDRFPDDPQLLRLADRLRSEVSRRSGPR